ncbi:MAG: hypothetical protein ACXADB_13745 [Candidatus Hermodarchaeia archaeon]|jgi:hypothetical protein
MNRQIALTCTVLSVVICLCLSIVVIIGAGLIIWRGEPTTLFSEFEKRPSEATVTPNPGDQNETPNLGKSNFTGINPGILAEMELIQQQIVRDRGLEPSGIFSRTLFSKDQLRQHVIEDFLEDYTQEEAEEDAIVLESIGLLSSDFDMYDFYLNLLSEQIAGFYDNETKEMVVVQGEKFGGTERLTYAHEYTHALQDQNYDIRDGLNFSDESCEDDSERCAAIQALIEGDASKSELNWFMNHAKTSDQSDIIDFYDTFKQPVMDSAPDFLSNDFLFPYEFGLLFVEYLYERGGWDAVDQAYSDLPVSTEQILHPEKYPEDKPIPVYLPNLSPILGEGWVELDLNVMGEWYTYLILAHGLEKKARLNEDVATEAAAGWGGDVYTVFYHADSDKTVMILRTLWETSIETDEFADAFKTYARDRFGKPVESQPDYAQWQGEAQIHTFHIESVYTTWISAPDEAIAGLVWNTLINE